MLSKALRSGKELIRPYYPMLSKALRSGKELIRPYYLKWLYFHLSKHHCPPHFRRWMAYPTFPAGPAVRELMPPQNGQPDVVFLPMADWHGLMQRTQQLARALADLGHRCVYVNPHLGRELPHPYLLSPRRTLLTSIAPGIIELHVHLPREPVFHHRCLRPSEVQVVEECISIALNAIDSTGQLLIVSFPLWIDVARHLRSDLGIPIVYDCHDLLEGFDDVSPDLLRAEGELMNAADFVVFSADSLRREHISRNPDLAGKSIVLRNAVNPSAFDPVFGSEYGRSRRTATIGYVGSLNFWFDIETVKLAASRHPEWRFLLVGTLAESVQWNVLKEFSNVHLIGEVDYQDLPPLMSEFDVGMIPFLIQPLTMATNPIKLYEYFACGLPVVSSPLPEVQRYSGLVYLATTPVDFVRQLEVAVSENDRALRHKRRRVAEDESWRKRCEVLVDVASRVHRR